MTTIMKVRHVTWYVKAELSDLILGLHTSRFPFAPNPQHSGLTSTRRWVFVSTNTLLYETISISERTASKVEGLLCDVVQSVSETTYEALMLYSPGICLEELSKATIDTV